MRQTRVLDTMAVTLDTLKAAVNLRYVEDGEYVIVSGNSQSELLRSPHAAAPLASGLLWTFLYGRAFAHTAADETYACLNVPGPKGVRPGSMLRDPLMAMYEELITRLPDFNGDAPGSWYLAVAFQDTLQFVYAEYLPSDLDGRKWSLSIIHGRFLDYSW